MGKETATQDAFEFVRENLKDSALRQRRLYDMHNDTPVFEAGESV